MPTSTPATHTIKKHGLSSKLHPTAGPSVLQPDYTGMGIVGWYFMPVGKSKAGSSILQPDGTGMWQALALYSLYSLTAAAGAWFPITLYSLMAPGACGRP